VIELGSFSAAAKKLGVTQPAISAHIKALEQELGNQLFIRELGKKTTLTEAGKVLYSYTLDITSKTNQVELNLKKLKENQKQVSIVAQHHIAHNILPPYLTMFNKIHPNINILMYTQTLEAVTKHIIEGKSEFGLITTVEPKDHNISVEGFYSEILSSTKLEYILVVGPTHELAHRSSIDPEEFENYDFVGPLKNSFYSNMTNLCLKKLGINNYNIVLQVEDYKTLIEVVKRGIGIACIYALDIQNELKEGHLVSLPIKCEMLHSDLRLIYNSDLKMSDEARIFRDFLRKEMNSTQSQFAGNITSEKVSLGLS
jgi:DNA-binding transcriptional LysR family regulator